MNPPIPFRPRSAPRADSDPTAAFPQSIEAERALLGGLLLDSAQVPEIAQSLKPEHFYNSGHAKLYALLIEHERQGYPLDILGLTDHILSTGEAEAFGGLTYATTLPQHVPTTENLGYYARIVREKATRRDVLDFAALARQQALTNPNGADEVLTAVSMGYEALRAGNEVAEDEDLPIADCADRWVAELDERQHAIRIGVQIGLPWGFAAMRAFGALQLKQVVILAGRPAMGKSELMFQILRRIASNAQRRQIGCVMVFSLEMPWERVFDRWCAALASVPYSKLTEQLDDDEIRRLNEAASTLRSLPIIINDKAKQSIQAMRRAVARATRKYGSVCAFGVDYIQLADSEDEASNAKRYELIDKVAYGAAAIAKDFGCAALLAAQLNRACEARQDKRPMMSDLREAGGLEQVADVIALIYRDGYYNPDSADKHQAEVIVVKNRGGGRTGTAILGWKNGTFTDGVERQADETSWRKTAEDRQYEEFE